LIDRVLLAAGLILLVAGGVLALVSHLRIETTTYTVSIPYYDFERKMPGNYTETTVIDLGTASGTVILGGGPHTRTETVDSRPEYCEKGTRKLVLTIEGTVENTTGNLYLSITAHRANGETITIADYSYTLHELSARPTTQTTTSGVAIIIPTNTVYTFTPSGEGLLQAELIGLPGSEGYIRIEIPQRVIEIPDDVDSVTLSMSSDLQGEVHYSLSVIDVCNITYTLEEAHLEPQPKFYYIDLPSPRGVDAGYLNISIAMIAVGNVLALLGLYLRLSKPLASAV